MVARWIVSGAPVAQHWAEDLSTRFEKADKDLMRPFNLEQAMRIADSQFNSTFLLDPDLWRVY